jgi:hypothetical protein
MFTVLKDYGSFLFPHDLSREGALDDWLKDKRKNFHYQHRELVEAYFGLPSMPLLYQREYKIEIITQTKDVVHAFSKERVRYLQDQNARMCGLHGIVHAVSSVMTDLPKNIKVCSYDTQEHLWKRQDDDTALPMIIFNDWGNHNYLSMTRYEASFDNNWPFFCITEK